MKQVQLGYKLSQVILAVDEVYAGTQEGEFWECGVYKGNTAKWIAFRIADYLVGRELKEVRTLRLFDTFTGRTEKSEFDQGSSNNEFKDTSYLNVHDVIPYGFVKWHIGDFSQTIKDIDPLTKIAFAHIDFDLYQPTCDALNFVLPRLVKGGLVILDDYKELTIWPGVTKAVEQCSELIKELGLETIEPLARSLMIRHKIDTKDIKGDWK